MRVLAVRVAPEHLTALWPIAMAELQRILLSAQATRPALLLAACQLIDTLLAVLPDDFSALSWMFVPAQSRPWSPPAAPAPPPAEAAAPAVASDSSSSRFVALLAPLCFQPADGEPPSARAGLLRPCPKGRRRPLLGMRALRHARELAPFAEQLSLHLARGAVRERAAEVDLAMVDLLIGCEYLSHEEARLQLEPHLQEPSTSLRVLDVLDSF